MDAIIKRMGENGEKSTAKVRQAVVVGGGFIGLEMAESLRHRGIEVALVEKLPQVMPAALDPEMAALVHKELRENGVALYLGAGLAGIEAGVKAGIEPGESESLNVRLDNGVALPCQMVILAIGVRPSTELGKAAGLKIGPRGGFAVDEFMRTDDPAIYAVGDAAETINLLTGEPMLCALAGPANRQGRLAADNILGHKTRYRGSQGTAIVKVFNLAAGQHWPHSRRLPPRRDRLAGGFHHRRIARQLLPRLKPRSPESYLFRAGGQNPRRAGYREGWRG